MKIYIPAHLKDRIGVIKMLYKMLEYQNKLTEEVASENTLSTDPIIKFLEYIRVTDRDIPYLKRLFFTVKGTPKVLEYLKIVLGDGIEVSYRDGDVTVRIDNLLTGCDFDVFCEYLEEFLLSLLWFKNLTISIDSSETNVTGSATTIITDGCKNYQRI